MTKHKKNYIYYPKISSPLFSRIIKYFKAFDTDISYYGNNLYTYGDWGRASVILYSNTISIDLRTKYTHMRLTFTDKSDDEILELVYKTFPPYLLNERIRKINYEICLSLIDYIPVYGHVFKDAEVDFNHKLFQYDN